MQYKQLCADCAAEMMRGAGHGGKIPDFSGTDMTFYVKDPKLKGGGFTDTLSSTWKKVKQFIRVPTRAKGREAGSIEGQASSVGSGKIMQSARTHETHPPTVLGGIFSPMYMDTTFFQISKKLPNLYISIQFFRKAWV